jgi:mannose-6-phosphate isomerase-like protein (cupin superfamily)
MSTPISTVSRSWGQYSVPEQFGDTVKLKILTVDPNQSLSMQRHQHRQEFWFVAEGSAVVYGLDATTNQEAEITKLEQFDVLQIGLGEWHRLVNNTDALLKIIEVQYGDRCVEEDIERKQ